MSDELRNIVQSWFEKAQNDWTTVKILMENEFHPQDVICYHCQQYVEKLLKGFLTGQEIKFPRTHDLRRLIQLSQELPQLSDLNDIADELTSYSVQSRYPDPFISVTNEQVKEAVEGAKSFAEILEPVLLGMLRNEC